jgi:hypothetical protein
MVTAPRGIVLAWHNDGRERVGCVQKTLEIVYSIFWDLRQLACEKGLKH